MDAKESFRQDWPAVKIYEIVRWLLPQGHHLPSTFGSLKGKSGTRIFRVAARKFQISKYSD